ncbi:MAG: glycerol-3-phosphate dehydrogenase [Actinomycetota bacterium]|jgi:glycerol-3-phosphate dehydrogenase (NAD(P)+)|nr:glycerol-3-phosphate dehydrogenase [Actinomycetota bacterium]
MTKLAFIGAGSWGTATAALVATKNEYETMLWARRPELAETINLYHENPEYLPDLQLPESLIATNDLERAVDGADVIVMGVPSHGYRAVLKEVAEIAGAKPCYVSLTKGLEVDTRKRMSEVMFEEVEGISDSCVAMLTGPNLAKEVVRGFPAASTVACKDEKTAQMLQDIFHGPTFRTYTNTDVVGCELGGAFKNVIAIAAGMADGIGYGDNTKATVMTRGLAEMARFGVTFGAQPLTFLGLAGVGDLMATCASPQSRNHTVGIELGKGRKIDEIVGSMNMVAEGVKSCKPILELGKEAGVWMPITENVVRICHEGSSLEEVVTDLLAREVRSEFAGIEEYLSLNEPD